MMEARVLSPVSNMSPLSLPTLPLSPSPSPCWLSQYSYFLRHHSLKLCNVWHHHLCDWHRRCHGQCHQPHLARSGCRLQKLHLSFGAASAISVLPTWKVPCHVCHNDSHDMSYQHCMEFHLKEMATSLTVTKCNPLSVGMVYEYDRVNVML
jgi:hypothetical protein